MVEEPINAESIGARRRLTEVYLDVTTLASEPIGTLATEIMDQVSTVGTQETWILGTVIYIHLTEATFPARETVTLESTLIKWGTYGIIITWVALFSARVHCYVTSWTSVARATQAFEGTHPWLIFTHGLVRTDILHTLIHFILTV